MENLILNLLALPLIGSALIIIIPRKYTNEIKIIGLINSILTFNWSMLLLLFFDSNTANFQFVTELKWSISKRIIEREFGIDGISLFFILLSTFLIPICIMVSWDYIQIYQKEFIITLLIIETLLIGVFTTLDLLGFYIFFESILMPMFFIIGIWGARERRILAAFQFFLYTLIGSFLMLLAILIIARTTGTTNIPELINNYEFSDQIQSILWLCFFLSFAVKVPMIPFHLWLPEAHVEAPTAGSVLLAGILLKLGSYGFLRISLPLFPNATELFSKGILITEKFLSTCGKGTISEVIT